MKRVACSTQLFLAMAIATATAFLAAPRHAAAQQKKADDAVPAFEQLVVKIEPFSLDSFRQIEQLQIEANGRCWYKVEGREAVRNITARPGAVFDHRLSAEHIERLNKLLTATVWLTAKGAEGRATHTHPTTVTLTLTRDGQRRAVVCQGNRPEPYAALLHALHGIATQERRIYLRSYVSGEAGAEAWAEIGREIAALRGDPSGQPVYSIDYGRYLPIAQQILRPFHTGADGELIAAVRLVGHFKAKSELKLLHRMAHDRSSNLRSEVAWALGQIHDPDSLTVLEGMMSAPANREAAGLRLITWGNQAVPHISKLIGMSTDARLDHSDHTIGEDMIRAYLDHWDKLDRPIDARVVAAVRRALENADPANALIRTTYHKEFLKRMETNPPQARES